MSRNLVEYALCFTHTKGEQVTYTKDKLERFAFRLDPETAKFLHEDSAALGMSSSAYLRMLVLSRRASLRVTQEVQAQTASATVAAVNAFADKALAIMKDSVADKADNPTNENK